MTDKIDTSPEALRPFIKRLSDSASRSPLDDKETRAVYTAASLLRTLAAEKSAWDAREAELEPQLRNLLAIIFRDGGQRTATFATLAEAVEAAHLEWAELVRERDKDEERWVRIAEACARWDWSHCTTERELIEQVDFTIQRAEQAEAEAAAMRAAWLGYIHDFGVEHNAGCPEDDTCACPHVAQINSVLSSTAGRDLLARIKELEQWEPSCARCGEKGPIDGIHRCKGEKS